MKFAPDTGEERSFPPYVSRQLTTYTCICLTHIHTNRLDDSHNLTTQLKGTFLRIKKELHEKKLEYEQLQEDYMVRMHGYVCI